jgi:hypothetical protein
MSIFSFDTWWWPYLFITLACAIPTGMWRWVGVLAIGDISEGSRWLVLVRCIATGLVAAVIGQIIFAPTGALAMLPLWARAGSMVFGFTVFLTLRRNMALGILSGQIALAVAWFVLVGV